MNTYGIDLMGRRRRRRHSAEFKTAVVQECRRPGVSIAAVALAHGLNANMLRKGVMDAEQRAPLPGAPAVPTDPEPLMPLANFVPLALTAPTVEGEIRIDLERSGTTIKAVWPAAAARECAAWLSEWLR